MPKNLDPMDNTKKFEEQKIVELTKENALC